MVRERSFIASAGYHLGGQRSIRLRPAPEAISGPPERRLGQVGEHLHFPPAARMVSSTSPDEAESSAMIIRPMESTAVGRRGTRPVSRKVITTGSPKAIDSSAKTMPIAEKKRSGRSDRLSFSIVLKMRK